MKTGKGFKGADVIVRKAQPFMTGQAAPTLLMPRQAPPYMAAERS